MSEPRLQEIASGVHAWVQPDGSWWLNNAGAVIADDQVVLIDTCATHHRTTLFLDAVAAVSGNASIRVAVNTHLHGDHTYGNALLPAETAIVAHTKTREGILEDFILNNTPPIWSPTPDWGITWLRPPSVVMHDHMSVYAGSTEVQLQHPGYPAHTLGDVIAWLPATKVLFTGDLIFHQVTPLVVMGSIAGALSSVDWLRTFPAAHIVPGHGPVLTGAEFTEILDQHARYYEFIQATASAGLTAGRTPLEAATSADLGEFTTLPDSERLVLNLHRAYAEATTTDLNLITAFTDAMTYNGGPLHCAL